MTFPKRVDFSRWLFDREGLTVPDAAIVIHSSYWEDRRREGKADVEWPDKVTYLICENELSDKLAFVALLLNAMSSADLNKIPATRKVDAKTWLYNRVSWAEQEGLKQ